MSQLPSYRSLNLIPPLVKRANNLARQMRYRFSCSNGTGRLLRLLASQFQGGVIGEIGTGCGVGSAWIISSLAPGTSFVTVEKDATLAAVARTLFDSYSMVRVLSGDWIEIVKFGPFSMVYVNARIARFIPPEVLMQALRLGGMVMIDSLVPLEQLSIDVQQQPDPVRNFWLNDSRLEATEILVNTEEAVILASRIE
jgi:predicted O-methyltransferase YrrM